MPPLLRARAAFRYPTAGYPDICRPKAYHFPRLRGVNDLLKRLGQRIRELRNEKGWSQEEFADVCGVHRTYMGHLERGEKNLSFRSIMRVASALDVPLSVLFSGIETAELETGVSGMSRGRFRIGKSQATFDRGRLLKEVATLERTLRTLKDVAGIHDDRSTQHAKSRNLKPKTSLKP